MVIVEVRLIYDFDIVNSHFKELFAVIASNIVIQK